MESSAGFYLTRPRHFRERRSSLVPVIVFAILAICGALAPPVLLAAETPVETQRNSVVVFIMIALLFGSMAAGLVFASPLRRRLIRTQPGSAGSGEETLARHAWPGPGRRAADRSVARPIAPRAQPTYEPEGAFAEWRTVSFDPQARYAQPAQVMQQPTPHSAGPQAPWPSPATGAVAGPSAPVPPIAHAPRPRPAPWSTTSPQVDSNWDPTRRQRPG